MKNYSNQLKLAPFALMIMLIVAGVQKCNAQTRQEIINEKGNNFTTGLTTDGVPYMVYVNVRDNVESVTSYYFDKDGQCRHRRIVEPLSQINDWVKLFNTTKVKLGELKWRDYENDYTIEITKSTSTVTINFY
jgi:hypothetical protein